MVLNQGQVPVLLSFLDMRVHLLQPRRPSPFKPTSRPPSCLASRLYSPVYALNVGTANRSENYAKIKIVHSQRPPRVIESVHDKGKKWNGKLLLRSKLGWSSRKRKRADKSKVCRGGGTLESTLFPLR